MPLCSFSWRRVRLCSGGKGKREMRMAAGVVSICLGVLCLLYFAGYALAAGLNNSFTYVWAALGAVGIAAPWLHRLVLQSGDVRWLYLERVFAAILLFGGIGILLMLGRILAEAAKAPDDHADYVIVLGAHVYGERMSANLQYRADAALAYLKRNPDTAAVLSGGQGAGEDISEAEAMRRYLTGQGIAPERLLLEDTSVNTEENIRNSIRCMGSREKKIMLVSNDFHIFRAKGVARKQGCTQIQGLAAKTRGYTIPNAYLREAVAVWIYLLRGKIA